MVLSVSAQLFLFTYLIITVSGAHNFERQDVQIRSSNTVPQCTYLDYVYDPAVDACVHQVNRVYCGENMVFQATGFSGEGSCVCRYEVQSAKWGRPQILSKTGDLCWSVGDRARCSQGRALLPVRGNIIKCGVDACASQQPRNAVGRSTWSEANPKSEYIFDFTYKGECYRTETKAFCKQGEIVRFVVPSKTPTCISRTDQGPVWLTLGYSTSSDVKLPCVDGFTEDRARHLCVAVADFDK